MPRGKHNSPNMFHPVKHSAVGSKNSTHQTGRDQVKEVENFVNDSLDKVVKHVRTKLPEEALKRLDVMGGIKEKLYNYVNQSFVNMFNRYLTTVEDEMAKKVRDFVDREEVKASNQYNPKEIAELLDQIGGPDKFNTGELEKSAINMYGHLQGHIQRGMTDLEQETNSLLRQKTDVGAFVRGQNFYSVVKCVFKDNKEKPKTVMDIKLSLNILDKELISPMFHHQSTVEFIVKEVITQQIIEDIDKELDSVNEDRVSAGKEELTPTNNILRKIGLVRNYTSDDIDDEKSNRYKYMAKDVMERIEGLKAEINPKDYDTLNIKENIKKVFDASDIRIRGFNTSINNLTSILDTSKLGYQYCENMKNCREFLIREYEDTNASQLPDERYSIRMKYYDQLQVNEERKAYDRMIKEFLNESQLVYDVAHGLIKKKKSSFRINDFWDLARRTKQFRKKNLKEGEVLYEEYPKNWDEVNDIPTEETEVEKQHRTYNREKLFIKQKIQISRDILKGLYNYQNPKERIVLDERINFLEKKMESFDYKINPYHLQPGLVLDIDIVTTKRKRYIMNGMSNVLNEFLRIMSKGFEDASFSAFSRRRSIVRSDLNQDFLNASDDKSENFYVANDLAGTESGVEKSNKAVPPPDDGDLEEL